MGTKYKIYQGVSYVYLLLTSGKGITNIKKRVTGDATYISGKHWQQTLANNGVLRRMLGRSYKHWEGATNVGERGKFGGAGKHIIGRNLGIDRALRHCFNAIYISGQGI